MGSKRRYNELRKVSSPLKLFCYIMHFEKMYSQLLSADSFINYCVLSSSVSLLVWISNFVLFILHRLIPEGKAKEGEGVINLLINLLIQLVILRHHYPLM